MELQSLLLCALVLSLASCQYQLDGGQSRAIADYQDDGKHKASHVTVCPEDYSPRDDCVTLDQLMLGNLIKSNTKFKFKPATFKIKSGSVIRFEHVSNITLESAGAYKVDITCVGNNSGFIFNNVSGLVVQNMIFSGCMTDTTPCSVVLSDMADPSWTMSLCVIGSSNIMLRNLTFRDGLGGMYAINMYGNFTVENSLFIRMGGSALSLYYIQSESCSQCFSVEEQLTVLITNSQFVDSCCFTSPEPVLELAYAINIRVGQWFTTVAVILVHLENVTITNNTHGYYTYGISISCRSNSTVLHTVIRGVNYAHNHVMREHSVGVQAEYVAADLYYYLALTDGKPHIEISNSSFVHNDGHNDFRKNSEPVKTSEIDIPTYYVLSFYSYHYDVTVSISNTFISNNTVWYAAAILVDYSSGHRCKFLLDNSIIANNSFFKSDYFKKGAVQLYSISNVTVHNCSVVNNSATGLLVDNSNIYFSGDNIIRGNKGYNGGGMALYFVSTLTLSENSKISFEDNLAKNNGGGLYAKDLSCTQSFSNYCCFEVLERKTTLLHFSNNSAKTAGNDWYGGNLYCSTFVVDRYYLGWKIFTDITDFPANYTLDLTSDPWHVCDCSTESSQDCIDVTRTIQTIHTYPGKMFNLSLLAVGQLLNISTLSGVPSAIYAGLLSLHNKSGIIPEIMRVQNGKRGCSNLTYSVSSSNPDEVMVLTVEDNIDKIPEYFLGLWQQNFDEWHYSTVVELLYDHLAVTVPAYVSVHLHHCPVWFELSEKGDCICSSSLTEYTESCSIDTMSIARKPPIWLSFVNSFQEHHGNVSYVYLIHKHCPFDYCLSGNFSFPLEDPDAQCNHNRSGILCGKCNPDYSLTLGTNECKQCTNIYLLLLIPFGLAGILLIVFLSFTDMTVTAGTNNGLLFFANTVRENQAAFFPPRAARGFLSVFIAWLNLDLGISTCLYDGLDAYAFTWLQFSFPIYIWLLAFSIIIASRHFAFLSKLCGRNIVHVLATLFLLSYTKFQRTIAAGLSFTIVDMTNGTNLFVWLSDGNVRYLEGKHVPLFLVSVLFLLALFIPYTLSITFGPWLQSKTQYKVFRWVLKLKPFFDAYFGPLKDKRRYWTGVLLTSRLILSLISSVNVLGDDNVNILATIILVFFLLVSLWQSGGVYKIWIISVLDSFFLINLGLLSLFTLYNKFTQVSDSAQYVTICVSVGSVFAVFCLILLYHCLKKLGLVAAISKRHPLRARVPLLEEVDNREENSDEDMLNVIDEGRISDPQIMRASNTVRSCDPDTY